MNFIKRAALMTTIGFSLMSVSAIAQTANVSRSDLPISGTNVVSGMQNASGIVYVPNDGKTLLVIKNNAGTAVTGTLVTQKTGLFKDGYGNIPLANETVTIPSASTVLVGPFPTSRWNTNSAVVAVSLSTPTGVSVTSVRLPQ